jgi:hypothetical protein
MDPNISPDHKVFISCLLFESVCRCNTEARYHRLAYQNDIWASAKMFSSGSYVQKTTKL